MTSPTTFQWCCSGVFWVLPTLTHFLPNSPTLHFLAAPSCLFFFSCPARCCLWYIFFSLWFCCFLHLSSVLNRPQLCGGQLHYKTTVVGGLLRGRANEREGGRGKETTKEISRAAVMKRSCLHLIYLLLAFTEWRDTRHSIKRRTGFLFPSVTTGWDQCSLLQIAQHRGFFFSLLFFYVLTCSHLLLKKKKMNGVSSVWQLHTRSSELNQANAIPQCSLVIHSEANASFGEVKFNATVALNFTRPKESLHALIHLFLSVQADLCALTFLRSTHTSRTERMLLIGAELPQLCPKAA